MYSYYMKRDLKALLDKYATQPIENDQQRMCIYCGENPVTPGLATCRASCLRKFTADFERNHKEDLADNNLVRGGSHLLNEISKRPATKKNLKFLLDEVIPNS
jgi:hypothetical protein